MAAVMGMQLGAQLLSGIMQSIFQHGNQNQSNGFGNGLQPGLGNDVDIRFEHNRRGDSLDISVHNFNPNQQISF